MSVLLAMSLRRYCSARPRYDGMHNFASSALQEAGGQAEFMAGDGFTCQSVQASSGRVIPELHDAVH